MTCLAISKSVFETLLLYANFRKRHLQSESLPDILRPCKLAVLRECVECLKSGSPWQVLISGIFSLLVYLYPIPERKRIDYTPPVEALGFAYRHCSRVKLFIQRFLDFKERLPAKGGRLYGRTPGGKLMQMKLGRWKEKYPKQTIKDLSFQRIYEMTAINIEEAHGPEKSNRCRRSNQNDLYVTNLAQAQPLIVSTYGAILIEAPSGLDPESVARHDICLFIVDNPDLLRENGAVSLAVEDILQKNMLHHTIIHDPLKDPEASRDLLWNLSLSYRSTTEEQRIDVMNWCKEF
jgi:hypothetical protein